MSYPSFPHDLNRRYRRRLPRLVIALAFTATVTVASAAPPLWQVRKSAHPVVTVDVSRKVRTALDPAAFFGFNLNHFTFAHQLWDERNATTKGDVIALLKTYFPGSRYRYPGGMVANGFHWQGSLGAPSKRLTHRNLYGDGRVKPAFGLDEYLQFLDAVDGGFWYVLNLVGTDPSAPWTEADVGDVAALNAELAGYLLQNRRVAGGKRYYQLGNELDRSKYEWPHDKVAARAKATVDAVAKVDADAEFVAFLREFKYRYKKDKRGEVSTPQALMGDVLAALPEVRSYSLLQYYDGLREDGKNWSVRFWLTKLNESIASYRRLRAGADPAIWITEHARQSTSNRAGSDNTRRVTSNLGASISTADYLTAMMQVPEVQGAFWHGLNAGPWQLFDAGVQHRDFRPRPIFWALAMMRAVVFPEVYATITHSPNVSGYDGGYDVRAVAFGDVVTDTNAANASEPGPARMGLWLINRAQKPVDVRLEIQNWPALSRVHTKDSALHIARQEMSAGAHVSADDPGVKLANSRPETRHQRIALDDLDALQLSLSPSSVTALVLKVE